MKNKLFFAILVSSMFLAAACGGQAPTAAADTPVPNSAKEPAAATPTSQAEVKNDPDEIILDPALAKNDASRDVISHVYETLVRVENGQLVTLLALDVTPSADNLDYVVTLRPGVVFHDGTKLNADAIVANFNRWFDPNDPLRGSGEYGTWLLHFGGFKGETDADGKPKSSFDGIEKQNETTVILHLNQPDPDLLTKLSDPAFSIVNPAALKVAGFGTVKGKDGGTGPYKIGVWSTSELTLDPFTSYWNASAVPASNLNVKFE